MKAFIKGRWFPLVVAVVGTVIIAFVMAWFGWRITYAPELETSWECVSAIASVAGAVGTVSAVWFAIRVADKQNKIALFEKRYAVYDILLHCISFSNSIRDNSDNSDISSIRSLFIVSFSYHPIIEDGSDKALFKECTKYAMDAKDKLDTASFLFNCNTDTYANSIICALFNLIFSGVNSETREIYCNEVEKMKEELLPQIKQELSLRKRII